MAFKPASSNAAWGKPKYGGNTFKKTGKPEEGDNFFRILPPMHSCAETGKWAVYETTHWGFFGVNPDPKGKPQARPFRCIEDVDFRTKLVRQECPACTEYNEQAAFAEKQLAELKAAGTSDDEIETQMASINGWLKDRRPERRWYINAMYPDGTFGDYKLNHKFHKKGLDALIAKYQEEEGKDPLDLQDGIWFNISRVGKGIGAVDTVKFGYDIEEVEIKGKMTKVEVIRSGALTEEQANKALDTCRDLVTLGGAVLTYEQIAELVNSDLEPETVDRIMKVKERNEEAAEKKAPPSPAPAPKAAPAPVAAKAPPTAPKTVDPKAALAERAAKILAAKKAAEEAAAAVAAAEAAAAAAPAEGTPTVDPSEMDDETFMKYFNDTQGA